DFSKAKTQAERTAANEGHPVALQAELLGIAINSIGEAWPAMRDHVLDHVKIIGYLPDATFRTCSASRYSGGGYFGNMDECLLDIEEGLVHETGHQVLYRLHDVTPITKPNLPQESAYELPWSGSTRDFFGYVHAFYIYVLLIKYFWRRAARADDATA